MGTTEQARPDTHETLVVHRVFRPEFHLMPQWEAVGTWGS